MQRVASLTKKMAEKRHLIEDKKLRYSGLVDIREFYRYLEKWLMNRNYVKSETKNFEEVTEAGKSASVELKPTKKISDYAMLQLKILITCFKSIDVDVKIDGQTKTMQDVEMEISFDAYLVTDYEDKWEMRPVYFFFRTIMDKFVYKGITSRHEQMVEKDCNDLIEEVKAFLNITKYRK